VRLLVTSTAGAGHYGPLAAFVRSFLDTGHDVLVAGPPALGPSVRVAEFWPLGAPEQAELDAVFARLPHVSHDEANAVIISEVFARLDAGAALPRAREAVATWRPDVVLHESAEFAGPIAATEHGVPHARVGIGLGVVERLMWELAQPCLPGAFDHEAEPHLTLFPESIEDPAVAPFARTARFRDPSWLPARAGEPLVYVTFGSVAGGMAMTAEVYRAALAAVADLPVPVVLTVGRDADPASFGPVPAHVRVERWVDQAEVLATASAVVCHGGGGSTLGALAAGVPLVVVPLFAEDQHVNARRVAAVGAGVAADPSSIRTALDTVLTEPSYRAAAAAVAEELAAQPSTDLAASALAACWSEVDS
jgi:UDP:flavonoid glycosyltransferase YjiC (YdhE family)